MTKKSYAKVNIFLKIANKRDNYHELVSRFVRVHNLFDTITFKKEVCLDFTLEGNFGCTTKQNTIFKAYEILANKYPIVIEYFKNHKVIVDKIIPEFAGLGGGSSNCATFMIMVNDICNLNLSKDILANIAQTIGADVPFFIYEYDSANVTGIGEIVKYFDEEPLNITVKTPKILCDTSEIFKTFREKYYKQITNIQANKLLNMKSIDILQSLTIDEANDLYSSAVYCNSELEATHKNYGNDYFFSGSGSSFFKIDGVK